MVKKTFLCLLVFLIISTSASASWVYYSMYELIDKSDLIVIGDIQPATEKVKTEMKGYYNTKWTVASKYILKGEANDNIYVVTPGAAGNKTQTSIDYELNQKGSKVLLFLSKDSDGDTYQPLTPRGVVGIIDNPNVHNEDLSLNERILSDYHFDSTDLDNSDRETLKLFIEEHETIELIDRKNIEDESIINNSAKIVTKEDLSNGKEKNYNDIVLFSTSIIGFLFIGAVVRKKIKEKL